MYTMERAVPGNMTGRGVDAVGGVRYTVVAYQNFPGRPDDGFLLAVNKDGSDYVTFAYTSSVDGQRVLVWDAELFPVEGRRPYDVFMTALANLMARLTA